MKNLRKLIPALFGISFFVFNLSMSAALKPQHKNANIIKESIWFGEEELLGYWNYTVANAPYEYSKGDLLINKEQEGFTVKIILGAGSINAESVVVQGNEINFKVYVEGSLVSVTLKAESETISGIAVTPEGTMQIKGVKGVIPQ